MDMSIISRLEEFLEDVPFPIDKSGLLQESLDSPLPLNVREAIALLPDREYRTRKELKDELLDLPFDDGVPKKDIENTLLEEVDDKMDNAVNLNEFTQMGDEEDHESI
jgi:hypothetical protein